jgi:23S rRNA (guanosine2251-2'-O)-methyltransferase
MVTHPWQPRSGDRSPEDGPVLRDPLPLTVVLDNLRSAFNVGSIFRTSEAARVGELILCGITPYPPNEKLDRTALGTVHRVAWRHEVSSVEAVRRLRREGVPVWACELAEGAVSIRALRFPRPTALVFGHEASGVSPEVLHEVSGVVEVPLYGRKNSLNVATTFGVVVFEVLRQWGY